MRGIRKSLRMCLLGILTLMLLTSISAPVLAADDCGCGEVIHVTGPEKYKILANLLKSDAFKAKAMELFKEGYQLHGINSIGSIDVEKNAYGEILIAIPILNPQGEQVFLLYARGQFVIVSL